MHDKSLRELRVKRQKRFPNTQFLILTGFCIVSIMLYAVSLNSKATYDVAEKKTATVIDTKDRRSSFDLAAAAAFAMESTPRLGMQLKRKAFNVSSWTKQSGGGLLDADRILLGELYGSAESVFEWGLGESTYIAAEVGVPRYGGVDNDSLWVTNARDQSPHHFRFYLGDTGPTGAFGNPKTKLPKAIVNYQISPLLAEERPFDVYMVDGRFRLACALIAFLHASSKGSERLSPKVLLHDYYHETHSKNCKGCHNQKFRFIYHRIEEVADLVTHSGGMLGVFQRKTNVTDEDILRLWNEVASNES